MTRYVFKMPDLGEGTVQAEIVAWHVKVGEVVQEDQIMAEVMTDKAAVEVPAPVTGRVVNMNGQPGDMIRVGAELIVFETESNAPPLEDPTAPAAMLGDGPASPAAAEPGETPHRAAVATPVAAAAAKPAPAAVSTAAVETTGRVKASPATRRKAREAGIDLRLVQGSGPTGRIDRETNKCVPSRGNALRRGARRRMPRRSRPRQAPEAAPASS